MTIAGQDNILNLPILYDGVNHNLQADTTVCVTKNIGNLSESHKSQCIYIYRYVSRVIKNNHLWLLVERERYISVWWVEYWYYSCKLGFGRFTLERNTHKQISSLVLNEKCMWNKNRRRKTHHGCRYFVSYYRLPIKLDCHTVVSNLYSNQKPLLIWHFISHQDARKYFRPYSGRSGIGECRVVGIIVVQSGTCITSSLISPKGTCWTVDHRHLLYLLNLGWKNNGSALGMIIVSKIMTPSFVSRVYAEHAHTRIKLVGIIEEAYPVTYPVR